MPPRAARSGMRGRPPLGLGGSCGSGGSIASQRSSGARVAAFMARHHATPPRFCNALLVPSETPGKQFLAAAARVALALPGRKMLKQGDVRHILPLALGWPTSPPLPFSRWRLLPLPGPRLVGLPHGDEAVPRDGLYSQAAAGAGPADDGASGPVPRLDGA